jgi:hypothetical protein
MPQARSDAASAKYEKRTTAKSASFQLMRGAAKEEKEPKLPIFCAAAKARFRSNDKAPTEITAQCSRSPAILRCVAAFEFAPFVTLSTLWRIDSRSAVKIETRLEPVETLK